MKGKGEDGGWTGDGRKGEGVVACFTLAHVLKDKKRLRLRVIHLIVYIN